MSARYSVCFTGFRSEPITDFTVELRQKGFNVDTSLKQTSNVLIAMHTGTDKWIAAMRAGIPVVSESWIGACREGPEPADVRQHAMKRLGGLRVSSSLLSIAERQRVEELCAQHGGEFSPVVDLGVAVVVTAGPVEGTQKDAPKPANMVSKVHQAIKFGIPVVTIDWLEAITDESQPPPNWQSYSAVPNQHDAFFDVHIRKQKAEYDKKARKAHASRVRARSSSTSSQAEGSVVNGNGNGNGNWLFAGASFHANTCCAPAELRALVAAHGGALFSTHETLALRPDPACGTCAGVLPKRRVAEGTWLTQCVKSGRTTPVAAPATVGPRVLLCCTDAPSSTLVQGTRPTQGSPAEWAAVRRMVEALGGTVVNAEVEAAVAAGLDREGASGGTVPHVTSMPHVTHVVVSPEDGGVSLSSHAFGSVLRRYLALAVAAFPVRPFPSVVAHCWVAASGDAGGFVDASAHTLSQTAPKAWDEFVRVFEVGCVQPPAQQPPPPPSPAPTAVAHAQTDAVAPVTAATDAAHAAGVSETPDVAAPDDRCDDGAVAEEEAPPPPQILPPPAAEAAGAAPLPASPPASAPQSPQEAEAPPQPCDSSPLPVADAVEAAAAAAAEQPAGSAATDGTAPATATQGVEAALEEFAGVLAGLDGDGGADDDDGAALSAAHSPQGALAALAASPLPRRSVAGGPRVSRKEMFDADVEDGPLVIRGITAASAASRTPDAAKVSPLQVVDESQYVRHSLLDDEGYFSKLQQRPHEGDERGSASKVPPPLLPQSSSGSSKKRSSSSSGGGGDSSSLTAPAAKRVCLPEKRAILFGATAADRPTITLSQKAAPHSVVEDIRYASHVIINRPTKSVHFLGGVAGGKWLLHPSYIEESNKQGRWVDEAPYEWSTQRMPADAGRGGRSGGSDEKLVESARLWRKQRGRAYAEWNSVAVVGDAKTAAYYTSILEAGSATLVQTAETEPGKPPMFVGATPAVIVYSASVSSAAIRQSMAAHPSATHVKADVLWQKLIIPALNVADPALAAVDYAVQRERKEERLRKKAR